MTDKQPLPQGDAAMLGLQRLVMGIFRGELAMFHAEDGDYCRWADAQAAIAARDARIAELEADIAELEADVAHANQGADERLVDLEAAQSELQPALETIEARDAEIERLRSALLSCARQAEALKATCGMDPESPQAVRNSRYQSISTTAHIALGTISGPAPEAAQPAGTEAQVQEVIERIERIEILTRKKYMTRETDMWPAIDAQLREARHTVLLAIRRLVGQ
jgi:DNA repair exonuclease SbcCD ATPase subunit